MGFVVLAGIFLLIALGLFFGAQFGMPKEIAKKYGDSGKNYTRTWIRLGSIAFLVFAAIAFIVPGFQSVPTKSVGVLTSYGRVQGTPYGPGGHWLVPWKTLNLVSDTIQSDSFNQSWGSKNPDSYTNSGAQGYCITVRLGGAQEGCADVQLQTQTNEAAVPDLFANYSSYGPNLTQDVDKYVVKRDLKTVLIRILGDYNPVKDVTQQLEACDLRQAASCSLNAASQFSQFDAPITAALQQALGNQVTVKDVNLQYIHYDPSTSKAIEKIQNSYTETAIAVQQEQTNAAISAANAALVKSNGDLTPKQLQQECMSIVQQAIKANYTLPLSWGNCLSVAATAPSSVIVNGTK